MSKGISNISENTLLRNFINAVTSGNVGLAGKLIEGTMSSYLEATPEFINQLKKTPSCWASQLGNSHKRHTRVRPGESPCRANRWVHKKSGPEVYWRRRTKWLECTSGKIILCSESFGNRCNDLCGALARTACKFASAKIESAPILPFLSCRMIGLDKNPGIRPVGIGEIFRRIVTAALIQNFRGETQNATGPMQTCAGARNGVEAAVHTMSGFFDDSTTEGILFVDADNAFNSLNRQAALHNISFICPEISTFLNNVFKSPTPLYIKQHVIMSWEGTTQGDVAAMQMYSIATKPMVYEDETNTKKSFYCRQWSRGREIWNGTWMVDIFPSAGTEVRIFSECEENNTSCQIGAVWAGPSNLCRVGCQCDYRRNQVFRRIRRTEGDMWSTNERKSWQTDNRPGKAKRTRQGQAACSL